VIKLDPKTKIAPDTSDTQPSSMGPSMGSVADEPKVAPDVSNAPAQSAGMPSSGVMGLGALDETSQTQQTKTVSAGSSPMASVKPPSMQSGVLMGNESAVGSDDSGSADEGQSMPSSADISSSTMSSMGQSAGPAMSSRDTTASPANVPTSSAGSSSVGGQTEPSDTVAGMTEEAGEDATSSTE